MRDIGVPTEQLRLSIIQALGGIQSPGARKALERHVPRASSVTEKAFLKRALSGG